MHVEINHGPVYNNNHLSDINLQIRHLTIETLETQGVEIYIQTKGEAKWLQELGQWRVELELGGGSGSGVRGKEG